MVIFLCLALGSAIVLLLYKYKISNAHQFWKLRSIPCLEPTSPLGNASGVITEFSYCEIVKRYYDKVSVSSDYAGFVLLTEPKFIPTSPDLIKKCLETDFNTFAERGLVKLKKYERKMNDNLYRIEGAEWRKQRNMYNAVFTPEILKTLFNRMHTAINEVVVYLDRVQGNDVDTLRLTRRLFTDVGSSCIYGVEAKSIAEPDNELYKAAESIIATDKTKAYLRILMSNFRSIAEKIGVNLYSPETEMLLMDQVRVYAKQGSTDDPAKNSIMRVLSDFKVRPFVFTRPDIDAITSQFVLAGFEKCSIALTYALVFMAEHDKIQQSAKKEVKKVLAKYNGNFTCDGISEMSLIDRIISETLRLYPPYPFLYRKTGANYELPNGSVLPKGTAVEVPIYCLHRDQRYYSDPEKFDPDRFLPENIAKRPAFTYLPFGEGPRSCIGSRYARMQLRLGLAIILNSYTVCLSDKTKLPLQLDKTAETTVPCGPVMLRFEKS